MNRFDNYCERKTVIVNLLATSMFHCDMTVKLTSQCIRIVAIWKMTFPYEFGMVLNQVLKIFIIDLLHGARNRS